MAMPGKDATPEDWTKYYDQLGMPKTADAYDLPVPDGQSDEFAKTAAGWMAEARLTPQQARDLAAKWNEHVAGMTTTQTEAAKQAEASKFQALDAANKRDEATLKNEWGQTFDAEMEHSKRGVQAFLKPIAGDKTAEVITAIENVVGFGGAVRFLNLIGKGLSEATARGLGIQAGAARDTSDAGRAARLYPSSTK